MTQDEVLDCHAHVVPEPLLRKASAGSEGVTAEPVDGGWAVTLPGAPSKTIKRPMVSPELRAERIHGQGISDQLLSPWMDLQPAAGMPASKARSWAARVNTALLEESGSGLGALATVALDDPDAAAEDLVGEVEAGMRGLVLSTDPAHCTSLADPRLTPLWQAAEQLGVPVLLHPVSDGPSRALPDSADYGNALCRLVDTTFAVSRLVFGGVLDRHPELRLVTVHGGGFLPYQAQRVDGAHRGDALAGHRLDRGSPSAYLSSMWFDTVALSPAAVRFLVDTVGAERVLLGTDYPFPIGGPDPVGNVRDAGLDQEQTDRVLGRTLRRLLDDAMARGAAHA